MQGISTPKTTTPSAERRSSARAPLDAPVLLDNQRTWSPGRCRNVSPDGLGIACESDLPIGDRVQIYFELPSGIAVEAYAIVVRKAGRDIGLRFTQIDTAGRGALAAHCRQVIGRLAPKKVARTSAK